MFCSKCGKENPESVNFCAGCGGALKQQQTQQQAQQAGGQSFSAPPPKKKKSIGKIILIVVGCLFVLSVIGNLLPETSDSPSSVATVNVETTNPAFSAFIAKADIYRDSFVLGKIDTNVTSIFIADCDAALAANTKEDKVYTSYIYAARSFAHSFQNEPKKVVADGKSSLELDPSAAENNPFMASYYTNIGNTDKGLVLLEAVVKDTKSYSDLSSSNKKVWNNQFENWRLLPSIITAKALHKEFKDNEVAAEMKFKDKRIAVKGKISEIKTDLSGDPQIVFDVGNYGMDTVSCDFDKDDIASIANLRKGQVISVIGECSNQIMGTVFIKDCRVVD